MQNFQTFSLHFFVAVKEIQLEKRPDGGLKTLGFIEHGIQQAGYERFSASSPRPTCLSCIWSDVCVVYVTMLDVRELKVDLGK